MVKNRQFKIQFEPSSLKASLSQKSLLNSSTVKEIEKKKYVYCVKTYGCCIQEHVTELLMPYLYQDHCQNSSYTELISSHYLEDHVKLKKINSFFIRSVVIPSFSTFQTTQLYDHEKEESKILWDQNHLEKTTVFHSYYVTPQTLDSQACHNVFQELKRYDSFTYSSYDDSFDLGDWIDSFIQKLRKWIFYKD